VRYLTGRAAPLKTAHAAVLSARGGRTNDGVDRAYLVLTVHMDVARLRHDDGVWVRRASDTGCADARFSVGDVFVYAAVDDDVQTRASDDPWGDAFRTRAFRLNCVVDPELELSTEERTRMEVERRLERLVAKCPNAALDEIIDQLLAQRDDMKRTLETD